LLIPGDPISSQFVLVLSSMPTKTAADREKPFPNGDTTRDLRLLLQKSSQ
jgi:hypothetical protein